MKLPENSYLNKSDETLKEIATDALDIIELFDNIINLTTIVQLYRGNTEAVTLAELNIETIDLMYQIQSVKL